MEKHLDRIATAFERIAATFEAIYHHGLEVYAKPGCFNLTGDINLDSIFVKLEGPLLLQHEFSEKLSIAVCNQKIGSEYYPFTIESK